MYFPSRRLARICNVSVHQSKRKRKTHADSDANKWDPAIWESGERPPWLYVEQRGLNEGCIETAPPPIPFSAESCLQRGLFPIQDTRPLDNTRQGPQGHTEGVESFNKISIRTLRSSPQGDQLRDQRSHMQTHVHAS